MNICIFLSVERITLMKLNKMRITTTTKNLRKLIIMFAFQYIAGVLEDAYKIFHSL